MNQKRPDGDLMFEDNFIPISPLALFHVQASCLHVDPKDAKAINKKEYLLPSLDKLTQETNFAKVHMGWNHTGLMFYCEIDSPFQDVSYPDIANGDSVELFIDTRDVKTSGFLTKFCHHFFFLPKAVDSHQAGEITRFRTEDFHELCDPNELHVAAEFKKSGYNLNIFIPSQCLNGYDPDQFDRVGFTYRVNRLGKPSQHFSVLSSEFKMEQQPSLWSSINLAKENLSLRKASRSKG